MPSGDPTTTVTSDYYYVYTECPHRDFCVNKDKRCDTCGNNPKRDYWIPITPAAPVVPSTPLPYYPFNPLVVTYS